MIKPLGSAAIALLLTSPALVSAASLETRLKRLEAQNAELESAVKRQEEIISERQTMMEGAPKRLDSFGEAVSKSGLRSSISGLIEVEAGYHSPYEGDSESDISLATFELGINARINNWVEAAVALLYEEDDTDLEVDVAFITIGNQEASPIFLTAGQLYVPFGAYETNLVSDPLTLEIGETRETAVQIGFVAGDFLGSAYIFNGDNNIKGENRIGSWGANLGYGFEGEDRAWAFGVGYISDLGDSDTLQGVTNENRVAALDAAIAAGGVEPIDYSVDPSERIGGWTINGAATFGSFNLIGEYLSATDDFDSDSLAFADTGAQPAAWNIEAGFTFPVMGRESVAAVAYQGTRDALTLELPKERWLVGWSIEVFERTSLSFEWARDTDYGQSDGGTGKSADTLTAQLAVEF